jgi:hypothetical protein
MAKAGIRILLITGAVLISLAASVAQASTEFSFGAGHEADLAVDSTGTAHVVWLDSSQGVGGDRIRYCRIPRGSRTCGDEQVLHTGSPFLSAPRVLLPSPGKVVVTLGTDTCGVNISCVKTRTSANDGLSFLSPVTESTGDFYANHSEEAVYGPGTSVSFVNDGTSQVWFTNAPLGGVPTSTHAQLTPDAAYGATVGLHGTTPVVVYNDGAALRWRRYDGAGDLNLASNWTPAEGIESSPIPEPVTLAGGPSGLFLFYERHTQAGDERVIRKFIGNGWSPATPVSGAGDLRQGDLSQDASGRLHAIWINSGSQPDSLEWRTSTDTDGVNWGPTVTVNVSDDMFPVHVGAAGDGQGFALWDSQQSASGAASDLRAVPLEPFTFPAEQPQQPQQPLAPGPDTTLPKLSQFAIGASTLDPGEGTSFVFTSNERGRAVLRFFKLRKGLKLRRSGALRCLPKTRKRLRRLRKSLAAKPAVAHLTGEARKRKVRKLVRKRRCVTSKRIGSIHKSVQAGRNEIVFTGRLAGHKLARGRYLAVLVVRDAAGNVSRSERVHFRVLGHATKR